jgi:prefoldin subunit 5
MKGDIILIILFLVILLYVIYTTFYKRQLVREFFNDTPPTSPQASQQQQPILLGDTQEYKTFFDWQTQFCTTWNEVIDNAMKVDQTSMTKDDYIQTLEGKLGKQLVQCDPKISASPDPRDIRELIPTSPELYINTMNYMGQEISKIKQQTQAALQGVAPKVENFQTQQQPCTCIQEPESVTSEKQEAIQDILSKLQTFNTNIPTLQGQLVVIQTGINDLNTYKEKAQSGEIYKEINIPSQ